MSRINSDVVDSYTKRKREEDEKKKIGGEASTSQPIILEPPNSQAALTSHETSPEMTNPISIICLEDVNSRKKARTDVGLKNFNVENSGFAYIAGNTTTVLIRSLMEYATSVSGKTMEEKEDLRGEIRELKKSNSKLKKAAKDADYAKKKAEEELKKAQTEATRLTSRVQELESLMKEMEAQKNERELKAVEEAKDAKKRILELRKEV